MPFKTLIAVLCVAISSAFIMFALPSLASKHTTKTTPPAKAAVNHHPKDWRFTMPTGDAAKGRAVFEKFECYYCHQIRGENFPSATENAPELSQMGQAHPVEFFAESIMNPNAVVPKVYRQQDGTSPMTDFTAKMTVQELIDVTAYVASLRPKGAPKTVNGEGKVVALVPEKSEIILEHGELKDFMEAMTMGYKVSPTSLIKGLKAGDSVQFTIDTEKRVITKVAKSPPTLDRKR
jgi:putative heme-binding domain-containing protein